MTHTGTAAQSAAPLADLAVTRARLYVTVVLFLCGFMAGAYEFCHPSGIGFGPGYEMVATARSIVTTGVFGNPFEPHMTGPTAANPPLYPLVLAGLIRLFGTPGFALVAVLLNIVMNAVIAAMLPRLSQIACGNWRSGIAAGFLWIAAMRLLPQWDTTSTVAGLLAFCILSAREVERSKSGVWAGILGGLVTLLNPSTVLIIAPWVVYLLIANRAPRRQAVRYVTLIVAGVIACNVPWVVRNYRTLHAPVLRTNFGYTIFSSNNDCARPSLFASIEAGCYQRTHPSGSAAEIALLQTLGELEYDRLRTRETMQWIRANPARFGELTVARFVEFWFPDPGATKRTNYAIWLITALSIPGVAMMIRRRERVVWPILATWALYPIMFYIVVSCDRYRVPLLWTSLLPAGYFVASLFAARSTVK